MTALFKKFTILLFMSLTHAVYADSLSIYAQNDIFTSNNRDRHYTHGSRIEYLNDNNWGLALGQYMYTPQDITDPNIILDDRPYCGWLYLAYNQSYTNDNYVDYWEVQLGAIGVYSYAEEAQKQVHIWTDSRTPRGWDNQIANEYGGNIIFQRKYKYSIIKNKFEINPFGGATLGNIYTGANIGLESRLGNNLPALFHHKTIEPSISKADLDIIKNIYVFAKVNNRLVLHNIALEGSVFNNNSLYTVEAEPYILEGEVGVVMRLSNLDLRYSILTRTEEFKGQKDNDTIGSITLTTYF